MLPIYLIYTNKTEKGILVVVTFHPKDNLQELSSTLHE